MKSWLTNAALIITFALPLHAGTSLADERFPEGYTEYTLLDLRQLSGTRFQYVAGGQDRCDIPHCLCKVSVTPISDSRTSTTRSVRRHSVFFSEGSSSLSDGQMQGFNDFLESSTAASYTVVGYTDGCGTHEYNRELVEDRVTSLRDRMTTSASSRVDSTIFNAEAGIGHDPAARRVDIIAHTSSRLTTMIDKIQADVYLIDASGSMWTGWKDWTDLIAASFKPGSRVYLSKTSSCRDHQNLRDVGPGGGTEIWYSYWKVLEWMQPGETLAIISDFQSDVPLTRRESFLIEQKVRERRITVIAIAP